MRSIRRSFALLALVSTFLLALLMGSVSVLAVVSATETDATQLMNSACAYEATQIDVVLAGIENAVDVEVDYVESRLSEVGVVPSGDQGATPEETRLDATQLDLVSELFDDVAINTNGAVLYFLRLDASSKGDPQGFIYTRLEGDGPFVEMGNLDALPGETDSEGNPTWDQTRLRLGYAQWVEPYATPGTDLLIALYVRPVFLDGHYVGIVGMGIDFQIVIDQVAAMSSYETGYGFLTDAQGNVMYHPTIPFGTNLSEDDEEVPAVDRAIAEGTTTDIVTYTYHGANKRMAFHLLQNDMRLVLSVDASEIYTVRDRLGWRLAIVSVLAAAFFVGLTIVMGRRALAPLDALTASAERVAAGDLDVEILSSDVKEISSLIDSYQRTVGDLRDRLAYIDGLAHRDGLTGAFNKSAYNEESDRIDQEIARARVEGSTAEPPRFATIMLDVNDLKTVNDNYGHEAGDEYLSIAVAEVMAVFGGSSVYRIGGDEFVVLVEGDAVDTIDDGIAKLKAIMEATADIEEPWRRISMAYGVAVFDPATDDSVTTTFGRADAEMYRIKQEMKS